MNKYKSPPYLVKIELVSGCNRICDFCGINALWKTKEDKKIEFMPMEIAEAICKDLNGWLGKKRIEFALRGEPTLHPELFKVISTFRANCPDAQLLVYSNGITLRKKGPKFINAIFESGINIMIVDTYDHRDETIDACKASEIPVIDYYEDKSFNPYYNHGPNNETIVIMGDIAENNKQRVTRVITNLAGNITPEAAVKYGASILSTPLNKMCGRLFKEMVIHFNGVVPICCVDWKNECTLGKFPEDGSLLNIWFSQRTNIMRYKLRHKERNFLPCYLCISGDTKIILVDGRTVAIKDLINENHFYVYSMDEDKMIKVAKAHSVRKTKSAKKLLKITFDNNLFLKCTYDHPILMRDGNYKEAQNIKVDDSIMPLYLRTPKEGYFKGYLEAKHQNSQLANSAQWSLVHHLSHEYNTTNNVYGLLDYYEIFWEEETKQYQLGKKQKTQKVTIGHHKDLNKLNNSPENIIRMTRPDHRKYHIYLPEAMAFLRIRASKHMKDLHANQKFAEEHAKRSATRLAIMDKDPKFQAKRSIGISNSEKFRQARKTQMNKPEFKKMSSKTITNLNYKPEFQLKSEFGRIASVARKAYKDYGEINENTYESCRPKGVIGWEVAQQKHTKEKIEQVNHRVVKIEEIAGEDVYDITVDTYHNFALAAGIFIHNCDYGGGFRLGLLPKMEPNIDAEAMNFDLETNYQKYAAFENKYAHKRKFFDPQQHGILSFMKGK